ncbi:mRNA export factor Gle1 [Culicoides brevitarsis]|uniref:mRNA export factor Gle1 n=1 Tax=Culicoides brevitarsis TaxID=469753 RepID=UPI00307C9AD3
METSKSNNFFDQDLEELIPFTSLRISALTSAARISKDVKNITIGPNAPQFSDENLNSSSNHDETTKNEPQTPVRDNKENINNNHSSSKKKNLYSATPEIDVYDSDPPSPKPISIDDIKYVSQKYQKTLNEREIKTQVKKELAERAARLQEIDKEREKKFMEAKKTAEKNLVERMIESEKFILQAVADVERLEREFEAEQRQKLEEMKRRELDLKERSKILTKFRSVHALFKQGIERFMKSYTEMDKDMQQAFAEFKTAAFQLNRAFENVVQAISGQGNFDQESVDKAEKYQKDLDSLTNDMISKFNEIKVAEQTAREAEETKRKQEQQQILQLQQQQQAKEQAAVQAATISEAKDVVDQPKPLQPAIQKTGMSQFVSEQSYQRYEAIMGVYRKSSEEVKKLSEDPNTKLFRMNCQKAVNTPINAISANSPEFLLDKYRKLEALLMEENVTVGNQQVSVKAHPLGKLYVTLLLSRKFVNQADTIMTSAAKAEFPLAAVVVALWTKFPEVGQFFLAYLYKDCPFFVPYFLPQVQGQSDEDYMKSLGYRYTNGVVEKHDLYLKRMVGIARLYAAIWVTSHRRGETKPHPHDLSNGWRWLAEILNLDPLPEICSTLIFEVLQVAGNAFLQVYGNQFIKLLTAIQTQYFPKLNLVDKGGPKARLEDFVTKVLTERKIDAPEGMLPPNFW